MRINKYLASVTGLSRRAADKAIEEGRVFVNGARATTGQEVTDTHEVRLDNQKLTVKPITQTILLNKPAGYVVSRNGQGSRTIYDLLPHELHHLKPVGRLDKDSSGLLLLTNDGQLAQKLTHPKYQKTKIYEVELDKPLSPKALQQLKKGVTLEDGPSHLEVSKTNVQRPSSNIYRVAMIQGRNHQIRRTFAALGYQVTALHRTHFGDYQLGYLKPSYFKLVDGQSSF